MALSGVSVLGGYLRHSSRAGHSHLLVSSVTNMQSPSPLRQELQMHRFFFFLIAPQCDTEHSGKFWNKILNCFQFAWGLIIWGAQNQHSWWLWDSQWPDSCQQQVLWFGQPGLGLAGAVCGVSWNVSWEHKEGSNYKTEKADSGLTKESGKNERAVPQSSGEFEGSQINLALLIRAEQLTDPKLLTCSYQGHPAPPPAILHTTWMVWFACAVQNSADYEQQLLRAPFFSIPRAQVSPACQCPGINSWSK